MAVLAPKILQTCASITLQSVTMNPYYEAIV